MTPTVLHAPAHRFVDLRARLSRARSARAQPRPPAFLVVVVTVAVLNIVGLVMILSASAVSALSAYGSSWYFFNRQLMWALAGTAAFLVTARLDYRTWARFAPGVYLATLVALGAVLVPGVGIEVDGARRWLGVGSVRFQPSELAKLALVLALAELLTRRAGAIDDARTVLRPVLVLLGAPAALILLEPDLDSTIVLALIVFAMLVVSGVPNRWLVRLGASGAGLAVALALAEPYRRARVFTFLDPWSDTSNTGYQISQSLIALGSGGIDGVGLGAGRSKWFFLPNAHTDFIFAVIGEELGLIGCLLVVGLFAGFALVGYQVARRAPDRAGMLLAVGITTWIAGQAAINLGAVVGLLPVSGITLPYLSAGGSSLVFTMAAAGILANIARRTPAPAPAEPPARPAPRARAERSR
ncbi:MAG TPA: putative lipid II flippase FtsW [Acidimicrobiia bacterium]|nr:putative lipid II flippase FtsW [Acidimicrobiia bacterium]